MASETNSASARKVLRERFARGEIDAEEYERSLGVLQTEQATSRRRLNPKLLATGLAAVALLAVGGGVAFAGNLPGSGDDSVEQDRAASGDAGSDGMGSMMDGNGMGSMTNGNGMSSMMDDEGGMGSMMDSSFDKDEPFDLQFIDQMTMHHEGAIMSSEHMISDSKRPELRKLAADIEQGQSAQIEQMKGFREEWYPDSKQAPGMMGEGMMDEMMGGSMREMMGDDTTDEMFLEMMIPHHQMAVDMAEKALADAEHPELKELAQKIKDEQSAQIELMKDYLEKIEASNDS